MKTYNILLKQILDKRVVNSISGGDAGSIWLIEFENDSYFLIYSAWRIEQNNQTKATYTDDDTDIIGLLSRSVKEIEGKKLLAYELSEQYDLNLFFEDNYNVKIFCLLSYSGTENGETYDTNWEFGIRQTHQMFYINNYFQVVEKPYEG